MTKKPQPLDLNEEDFKFIDNFFEKHRIKEGSGLKPLVSFAINEYKQRLKSACEFYLRYKDKPELLIKEYPKYEEEINNFLFWGFPKNNPITHELEKKGFKVRGYINSDYNEWLFKLAFKDVLEEEK